MIFYLDLIKDDGIYTLTIESNNTPLGKAWGQMLKDMVDSGISISEPERIYALNDKWNLNIIKEQLLGYIDIINDYKDNTIIYKDDLNYLHKYFEDFMRKDKPQHEFYIKSPKLVQRAIREFNILIHRYEHMERNKGGKIVVSLDNRPTRLMTPEEASEFNTKIEAGDVTLKYCHKGKKVIDIFIDGELDNKHVGNKNIIPQREISADFKIYFDNPFKPDFDLRFNKWLNQNIDFFKDIGIDFNDPTNTIGFGKVGKILGPIDIIEKELYGVKEIYNVRYN